MRYNPRVPPEFTNLGKTPISITRFAIGGWQVADWATSNESNFERIALQAIDHGLNFIDTAESYGAGLSENVIARILQARGRDNLIVASKFSANNSSPGRLAQSLEGTLRRLKTDYIDLYQQHWPTHRTPPEVTISELVKLKEAGKIRAIGVSNWTAKEWDCIGELSHIDAFQACYNLIYRTLEKSAMKLCREHSIAVLPYSPLAQGVLAGRFNDLAQLPAKPSDPRLQNRFLKPGIFPHVRTFVAELSKLALRYGKTPAQIALRWLLDTPGICSAIVGMSSEQQLQENLGAFGWQLASADYQALSKAGSEVAPALSETDRLWDSHPEKETINAH